MWQQRLGTASAFCRAVVSNGYLTEAQMQHAAQRYRLGVSRDGGVIFWQIDTTGSILDGKIMYYRPDCHRDHKRHPQWVSNRLKHYYLGDDVELIASIPSYHCLFGTHLLMEDVRCKMADVFSQTSSFRLHTSDVAVVEAEKTAVILSEHYPAYLWLAAGGLFELTADKLFPLRRHRIVLFPSSPIPIPLSRPTPVGMRSPVKPAACTAATSQSVRCWNCVPRPSRSSAR